VFATNVAFGQSVADAFALMERLQLTEMIVLTFCGVQRDGMDTREASILKGKIYADGLWSSIV
jgi:hypothetical protein